jgi:hypothetical protein
MHDHNFNIFYPMFWGLFALAIVLTRSFFRHRERMRALEVSNRLLEKGVAIPPEMVDAMKPPMRPPPSAARDLRTGAILLAVAFAMAITGFMIASGDPAAAARHGGFNPLYGGAFFPGLIGVVLLGFGLAGGRSRLDR